MSTTNDDFIKLSNTMAECTIAPWGANLISYRPRNQEHDIFWLGERNLFNRVQAIRGGIPVCWPRVAEEKRNEKLPRHGFARISEWHLQSVHVDETKMETKLSLIPAPEFKINATASLLVKITDCLEYQLETANNGKETFEFSEALHAYFNISSLDNVAIKGLSGQSYKNSLDGKLYTLENDLKINGEFDAVFIRHSGNIELWDAGFNRVITVEKSGSATTVVWNPAKDLAEMSPKQYKKFVCIEPSNQGDSFVRLSPGETHRIAMKIRVKNLK